MADPKLVFLVSGQAGSDPVKRRSENTFANVAWLRVFELVGIFNRDLKKAGAAVVTGDEVDFVHFRSHLSADATFPRVEIYKHSFATARAAPFSASWTALTDEGSFIEWQPVRDAKDAAKAAAQKPFHAVSIVNVYHSIRRAPAASVLELSIFSHAFVEGPVLTDTDADPNVAPTTRTSEDTDGRALSDFTDSMGEDPKVELGPYVKGQPPPSGGKGPGGITAIQQFRNGFAASGTLRVWGCNIQDIVIAVPPPTADNPHPVAGRCLVLSTPREVIEEAYSRPLKAGGSLAGALRGATLPAGDTVFTLDMGNQMHFERGLQSDPSAGHGFTPFDEATLLQVHYNAFPDFFKPQDMGSTLQKKIDRTFSEIASFVSGVMMTSYAFAAAKALPAVTVFAGAPGTSADLSDTVQMHLEWARIAEANFFAKVTGTSLHDDLSLVQRSYSKLDAAAVTAIENVKNNGLPT